jgi:hypothetical protein
VKRAAIIVTNADRITGQGYEGEGWRAVSWFSECTSEQLLADLRTVLAFAETYHEVARPAARVRALLPKEDEDAQ